MKELIKKISKLVSQEIVIEMQESDDYGEIPSECHDSFGGFSLRGYCEPEDAIWMRDLSDNYYTGLDLGVRNTLKVLKDNPDLLKEI